MVTYVFVQIRGLTRALLHPAFLCQLSGLMVCRVKRDLLGPGHLFPDGDFAGIVTPVRRVRSTPSASSSACLPETVKLRGLGWHHLDLFAFPEQPPQPAWPVCRVWGRLPSTGCQNHGQLLLQSLSRVLVSAISKEDHFALLSFFWTAEEAVGPGSLPLSCFSSSYWSVQVFFLFWSPLNTKSQGWLSGSVG